MNENSKTLTKSDQNSQKKSSDKKAEDIDQIDKELKELIDKNESLKKGISKLFIEINKETTN